MQHNILLPDLAQTTSEAKISRWLKRLGDHVARGEPVMIVETDKVDMEVECFESGYIREYLVAEGSIVKSLEPVAILTETPDESYSAIHAKATEAATVLNGPGSAGAAPAARVLAKNLGVDVADVTGTGPKGLITRTDVARFAEARQNDSVPKHCPVTTAAATVEASKIGDFYVSRDMGMASAVRWRDAWNRMHPNAHASFNDIFVWCAARALADVPRLNVAYGDGSVEQQTTADLLVVVIRDHASRLMPVADPRSLDWDHFLQRVHASQHPPTEITPRLAISDLGTYGIKEFSAMIPQGCSAVLAIGAVREAAVVREGAIVIERVSTCTLSVDYRVIDGIAAAQFLDRVQVHLNSL